MPISICKHGAPFVVQHENRYGSGASQSSSLSKSIRHISNSHEEIKFISCYSANGACFSNAQMLANASGRPVIGYYGKINKLTASLEAYRYGRSVLSSIVAMGSSAVISRSCQPAFY